MATSTILKFLTAAVCIHLSVGLGLEFLYGTNEEYNKLCVLDEPNSWFPMPDYMCDLRSFLICWGRLAFVKDVCSSGKRFNRHSGWCEPLSEVPLPEVCKEEINAAPKTPKFCSEIGEGYLPHPNTCKKYIWCIGGGNNHTMPCQLEAFFIHGEGFNKCMFDREHFRAEIPEEQLLECRKKDPYTADDFTTKPPATATTKPPATTTATSTTTTTTKRISN